MVESGISNNNGSSGLAQVQQSSVQQKPAGIDAAYQGEFETYLITALNDSLIKKSKLIKDKLVNKHLF